MTFRNRLGRRWRSVSFRAGLWSALLAGLLGILTSVVYSTVVAAQGNTGATDGLFQTIVLDQIEDQIASGVSPNELAIRMYHADGPPNPTWTFWAVLNEDVVVASDGVVSDNVLDGPYIDLAVYAEDRMFPRTIKQPVGTQWFVVERDITSTDGVRPLRAVAAIENIASQRAQIEFDLQRNTNTLLLLMFGTLVITSFFTRRALRRVEKMRVAVQAITDESLDQRVPLGNAADTIDKLAITMNDMLARLERSSDQQNQFLADASHELRSPVAGLLAQIEVAAAYPDRVDNDVLLPKLEAEAQRLQSLVNDLFFLSRSEAQAQAASASTPGAGPQATIGDIIEAEVAHQELVGARAKLVITSRSEEAVAGNARDIERAIRNLVNNAVRHANATVQIGFRRDGPDVVITVADDGAGVPVEEAEHIFDRFVRLDEARSRDAGGAGLGLAITRQIARKHGGVVRLIDSPTGANFELRLPAAAARV